MTFLSDPFVKYYLSALVILYPLIRIFRRAGLPPVYAITVLVPFIGYIVAVAVLALQRWPVLPPRVSKAKTDGAV